jgi:hypothetical protein
MSAALLAVASSSSGPRIGGAIIRPGAREVTVLGRGLFLAQGACCGKPLARRAATWWAPSSQREAVPSDAP